MNQKDEVIKKIKTKGYWIINIHPEVFVEKRIESRSKVKEIIRNAVVRLRGWPYPCYLEQSKFAPYEIVNGIESFCDSESEIEFWRMAQSTNFVHLLALREDWWRDLEYRNIWSRGDELKGKKLLGVLGTLYTLTESFEFAKRLAGQKIFGENIIVTIELYNLLNRHLFVDSHSRVPFHFSPVSKTNGPWKWDKNCTVEDILNKTHEFSFNAFRDLIDLFGWQDPPIDNLKNDQQKFLQGKI